MRRDYRPLNSIERARLISSLERVRRGLPDVDLGAIEVLMQRTINDLHRGAHLLDGTINLLASRTPGLSLERRFIAAESIRDIADHNERIEQHLTEKLRCLAHRIEQRVN
jgi:hypothetical protein